jgi:hypothetical protein
VLCDSPSAELRRSSLSGETRWPTRPWGYHRLDPVRCGWQLLGGVNLRGSFYLKNGLLYKRGAN